MFWRKQKYNGVPDLGSEKQKEKLYQFKELVSAPASVSFGETNPDLWKIYPLRNQSGKNTCVFESRAKMAGILQEQKHGEFIEYSALDYNKRTNGGPGAWPIEALDLMRKEGIGLEALEESQKFKNDTELSQVKQTEFEKQVAKASLLDAYIALPAYNFDLFVSTLHATQKPIMIGFFATLSEWNRDIVEIRTPDLNINDAYVRHEVCATPNYGVYKGMEGFTVEDSWGSAGINNKGVRFITREFFEKRNYLPGLVPTSFKPYTVEPAPLQVNLTKDLYFNMTDPDVRVLQEVYKREGLFPANHEGSIYFGSLTLKCTQEFQIKYGIAGPGLPGFGRVGPKTREFINNKYK